MNEPTKPNLQPQLSEPARACAFVVENIDIGALYPIPAKRVYMQPIEVFNITEEPQCS